MSFVLTDPESVQTAAHDLANIRGTLGEATTAAASHTTGIAAAAADEVSAGVASLFNTYAREYQAVSAYAAAFHDQFVNVLNTGAGAYGSTEAVNAEQNLLHAAQAPAPAALKTLESFAAPALIRANQAVSEVAGPYQTLFANTAANLESIGSAWSANPAPFLHQIIENHVAYAQLIATAFEHAAQSFGAGLAALPAAFQSAYQALLAGDVSGAVADLADGFANLFVTGINFSDLSNITLTGAVGDLLTLSVIPGEISQNLTNVIKTVTDTTISMNITNLTFNMGLPLTLVVDAAGPAITTLNALGTSATAFTQAVQAGDIGAAMIALVDAPAVVANGFLNGQAVVNMSLPTSLVPLSTSVTAHIPVGGVLAPMEYVSATATFPRPLPPVNITLGGTTFGGIVPALLTWAPEQLADAIK